MTPKGRQTFLLVVLGLIFVIAIWRVVPASWKGSSTGQGGRRAGGSRKAPAEVEVLELRLADLDRETGEYRPGRDPFRYEQAPPARPEREIAPPALTRAREEEQIVTAAPEVLEPPKPKPPPVDVVYLGSFGPDDHKIAVFSDNDTIYNAGVGDVVGERFILVQIGFESVDLKFVGFPDEPAERLSVGG